MQEQIFYQKKIILTHSYKCCIFLTMLHFCQSNFKVVISRIFKLRLEFKVIFGYQFILHFFHVIIQQNKDTEPDQFQRQFMNPLSMQHQQLENEKNQLILGDVVFDLTLTKAHSQMIIEQFGTYKQRTQDSQKVNLENIHEQDMIYVKEFRSSFLYAWKVFVNIRDPKKLRLNPPLEEEKRIYQNQMGRQKIQFGDIGLIIHISFPNLVQLSLEYLNLTNIQALSYLDAPLLKKLELRRGNHIQSLKPLQKNILKRLQFISLHGNHLSDLSSLNRSHFPNLRIYENRMNRLPRSKRAIQNESKERIRDRWERIQQWMQIHNLMSRQQQQVNVNCIPQFSLYFLAKMNNTQFEQIDCENKQVGLRYVSFLEKLNQYAIVQFSS